MNDLADLTPDAFCSWLSAQSIARFYLVWDEASGAVRASHEALAPLADLLSDDGRDYAGHEGVFVQIAPDTGVLQAAFIHRTCRGQGAGGTRFWHYDTVEEFLRDGLRLSQGMTHKNALAGLWWGGGKGVLARDTGIDPAEPGVRRRIYEEYGEFITSLSGCYVTAEDVGTSVEDMAAIFSKTRFTTCIPREIGGSGNPSAPTALGVVRGMEAALSHRGLGSLEGKAVAVMGLGHVGTPLVGYLHERGVRRVIGADMDPGREEALSALYPDLDLEVRTVKRGDLSLFTERVDVLAPCATGGVLNPATIPTIGAPIICGAANNQLEDPNRDDRLLAERGILYMPDFLVNRMGIVNCADEHLGYVDDDRMLQRHLGIDWDNSIYNLSRTILAEAERTGRTPAGMALEMAEWRSQELHPLTGHRGAEIIRSLVEGGWA
jgi:glutamate dehydrogenase/leucine dehydrogenase